MFSIKIVTVNVSEAYIDAIERLVGENGLYPSRSELIRVATREFLLRELKKAKKMAKHKGHTIDDITEEADPDNLVRIPIESKDEKEPIKTFRTYKILRRLEISKGAKEPFETRDLKEKENEDEDYSDEEIKKYFKLGNKMPKEPKTPTLAELREQFPDNPSFRFINESFPEKPNI